MCVSSRSGTGQVQPSTSMMSATDAHLARLGQPAELVVRRAGALAGDHGRAERGAWRTQGAEGGALVGLDEALQYLAAVAVGGLGNGQVADLEPYLRVEVPV